MRESDREWTTRRLDAALDDGTLTAERHRALSDRVSSAQTLPELAELLQDLPPVASGEGADGPRVGTNMVLTGAIVVLVAVVALVCIALLG